MALQNGQTIKIQSHIKIAKNKNNRIERNYI